VRTRESFTPKLPPHLIIDAPMCSRPYFPTDTFLPFTLSKDSAYLLHINCEVQIYIHDNMLVNVIVLLQ
jgi:hypothetical protein